MIWQKKTVIRLAVLAILGIGLFFVGGEIWLNSDYEGAIDHHPLREWYMKRCITGDNSEAIDYCVAILASDSLSQKYGISDRSTFIPALLVRREREQEPLRKVYFSYVAAGAGHVPSADEWEIAKVCATSDVTLERNVAGILATTDGAWCRQAEEIVLILLDGRASAYDESSMLVVIEGLDKENVTDLVRPKLLAIYQDRSAIDWLSNDKSAVKKLEDLLGITEEDDGA